MKKEETTAGNSNTIKKGYNEENPGQPEGAFPPASDQEEKKTSTKSNAADKKTKEDQD